MMFVLGNPSSEPFTSGTTKGVTIKQTVGDMPCNYSIATRQSASNVVNYCTQFDATGNGESIWSDLKQNGKLTNQEVDASVKGEIRI